MRPLWLHLWCRLVLQYDTGFWKKEKSLKFIVRVAATCVFVQFVMLLINIGLKMPPPDSCKQPLK